MKLTNIFILIFVTFFYMTKSHSLVSDSGLKPSQITEEDLSDINLDPIYNKQKNIGQFFIRVKNNLPHCLYIIDGHQSELQETIEQIDLPLCHTHSEEIMDDITQGLEILESGRDGLEVAFLSHLGFGVVGCMGSFIGTLVGAKVGTESNLVDRSKNHNPAIGGTIGAAAFTPFFTPAAAAITAGHSVSLASGYISCAAGINYLLYTTWKD